MNKTNSTKRAAANRGQIFSLNAPTAKSVQLAGNFTQWEKYPITMEKNVDGIWQTTVEMSSGEYQYRFLVDDEWRDDEESSSYLTNPFGSRNAVRLVD